MPGVEHIKQQKEVYGNWEALKSPEFYGKATVQLRTICKTVNNPEGRAAPENILPCRHDVGTGSQRPLWERRVKQGGWVLLPRVTERSGRDELDKRHKQKLMRQNTAMTTLPLSPGLRVLTTFLSCTANLNIKGTFQKLLRPARWKWNGHLKPDAIFPDLPVFNNQQTADQLRFASSTTHIFFWKTRAKDEHGLVGCQGGRECPRL